MNLDTVIAPVVAIASLVYAGLSTVKATTAYLAPAMSGYAQAPGAVRSGDIVPLTWTVTRRTDCPSVAARHWTGANGFVLTEPAGPATWPVARAPTVTVMPTQVPALAPAGHLSLSVEGEYACPGQPPVQYRLGPVEMMVVGDGK